MATIRIHGRSALVTGITLCLWGCTNSPPVAAPARPDVAAGALSRFAAIIRAGGELYEPRDGQCKRWTVSPSTASSTQEMAHVVGDGRKLVYEIAYDEERRSLYLAGPGTRYDEPPCRDGYCLIGSAAYCSQHVHVRGAPEGKAVLFGDRPWHLSSESCRQAIRRPAPARALARIPLCHEAHST